MLRRLIIICAIAVIALGGNAALVSVASADVVIDWNNVLLDIIRAEPENPPRATRALAMMHTAMYDAVNGIEQAYKPYLITEHAPPGASPEAAAAVAAYTVLMALYPQHSQDLDDALDKSLAAVPPGASKSEGQDWGRYCAEQILALRDNDGADANVPYQPSGQFGRWQPTPPNFAPALLPQWPYVTPFCMISGDQFRVEPPPPFTSTEYALAFNEVKALGEVLSVTRTADQTEIAYFWEDGPGSVTPPGHWQVITQQIADMLGNTMFENARLFALLSIIQADAAIVSWDNKYFYDHVRPYTAITQEADLDGNPATAADPTWFNLVPTPPFPTYTSGHSTFSSASSKILGLFFGRDDIAFSAPSPDPNLWPAQLTGVVRSWDSLSQASEEAGQSRIYGGIHWQYDNTKGLESGGALAEYVFENCLTPLPRPSPAGGLIVPVSKLELLVLGPFDWAQVLLGSGQAPWLALAALAALTLVLVRRRRA